MFSVNLLFYQAKFEPEAFKYAAQHINHTGMKQLLLEQCILMFNGMDDAVVKLLATKVLCMVVFASCVIF